MYRLLVFLAVVECHDFGNSNFPWKNHPHHHFGGTGHHHHHHFSGSGHHHFSGPGHHLPCGRDHNAGGSPENVPGSTFKDIGKYMIFIDNALKKFCDENNINSTSELYGQDNYILKYQLPGFKESDFEVKIMNRLIYTAANSKFSNLKAFKDLRILPGTINTSKASWIYEHKTLKVYIPYKTNSRNEEIQYCDDVDEAVKNVPNMKLSGFEYRNYNRNR